MSCLKTLSENAFFQSRRTYSENKIKEISKIASSLDVLNDHRLSVFVAGSLGRLEMGMKSDIDFFPITEDTIFGDSYLEGCKVVSSLYELNKAMEGPDFSNDGRFLRLYKSQDITGNIGYQDDDSVNSFTTRMLLLLEGRTAINPNHVNDIRKNIANHYFRDRRGKSSFRPLFLLNDVLRYWRTLCLNYEIVRTEDRPWRKRNINLKFSRLITVFASVLAILKEPVDTPEKLLILCELTPLERLARTLDSINDQKLTLDFEKIITIYQKFLEWKDDSDAEEKLSQLKDAINKSSEEFSSFIYDCLMHESIPKELRRYLVI